MQARASAQILRRGCAGRYRVHPKINARVAWRLMLPHLTAQHQARRCPCGRYLAWQVLGLGTQNARYADPVCCRCWAVP